MELADKFGPERSDFFLQMVHFARVRSTNVAGHQSQIKCSQARWTLIFNYRVSNYLQEQAIENVDSCVSHLNAARHSERRSCFRTASLKLRNRHVGCGATVPDRPGSTLQGHCGCGHGGRSKAANPDRERSPDDGAYGRKKMLDRVSMPSFQCVTLVAKLERKTDARV